MNAYRTPIHRWLIALAVLGAELLGAVSLAAEPDTNQLATLKKQIEQLSERVQQLETQLAGEKGRPAPVSSAGTNGVSATPTDPRVDQLDQQVRILERKQELEQEAAAERAKTTPTVTVGSSGLQVRSADSNFVFNLHGYVQFDGRFGVGDTAAAYVDTFLMRRVRPIFDGTLYKFVDYRVMLDFASGITSSSASANSLSNDGFLQDAYANLRFLPELQLQVGKMKEPVGLERLQSGANLLFIERGYPTALVPNRNVGAMLQGDLLGQRLTYQAGVFNGVADGGSTDFQGFEAGNVAGRIFSTPFHGSGIEALEGFVVGVAGTVGNLDGALRSYGSPGQQTVFSYLTGTGTNANVVADGQQWRVSPQGYYYWGPFGLFGEYVVSSQDVRQSGGGPTAGAAGTLVNRAWQIAGSWFVTGEKNGWKAVAPKDPLTLAGRGWGALELAARVQGIDFDDDAFPVFANPSRSITRAFSWGVGVNWHLNRNLKLSLDYEQTRFDGGNLNPLTAQDEQVILTRLQFSF
jgi:phosphate-selective porin OprO and OprP